jgi:CBS domain-containing protein
MAQQQTVREAMNDDAATIGPDSSIVDAARLMRDEDVSIIAVVDDQEALIGVLTDRDIALLVVAEGIDAQTATVGETMSNQPVSVGEDDSLDQAFRQMLDENVHHAPVTGNDGHVAGTLSQNDAVREGEGRRAGKSRGSSSTKKGSSQ